MVFALACLAAFLLLGGCATIEVWEQAPIGAIGWLLELGEAMIVTDILGTLFTIATWF